MEENRSLNTEQNNQENNLNNNFGQAENSVTNDDIAFLTSRLHFAELEIQRQRQLLSNVELTHLALDNYGEVSDSLEEDTIANLYEWLENNTVNLRWDVLRFARTIVNATRNNLPENEIIVLRRQFIGFLEMHDVDQEFEDFLIDQMRFFSGEVEFVQIDKNLNENLIIHSKDEFERLKSLPGANIKTIEECSICLEEESTYGYLHNGLVHIVTCKDCFDALYESGAVKCPVCNVIVNGVVKTI